MFVSAKDRTSLVTFEDPRTHAVAFELSPAKVPCEMFEVPVVTLDYKSTLLFVRLSVCHVHAFCTVGIVTQAPG